MDLAAPITNIEEDLGPPLSHAMKAEDTSSSHSSSSLIRYVALQKTTVLNCPAPPQPLSRSLDLSLLLSLSRFRFSGFRFRLICFLEKLRCHSPREEEEEDCASSS